MAATAPVILFDGVCNFCNGGINLVIRQDKKNIIKFAPLQSSAGQQLLNKYKLPATGFASFVFVEDEKAYQKSTAALKVMNRLPWYWKWTQVFWIMPPFIRDSIYDFVAKNRYKWFGRKEVCMIPTPEVKSRFLD